MNDTDYVNKVKLLLPFFHLKVQNNQLPESENKMHKRFK